MSDSSSFPESPYDDKEADALANDPLIRRPEPFVLCRQSGQSFFYYHEQCASPEQYEYVQVPLADCAPETWCCGCWGSVHEPVREMRPVDEAHLNTEF